MWKCRPYAIEEACVINVGFVVASRKRDQVPVWRESRVVDLEFATCFSFIVLKAVEDRRLA